MASVHGSIHIPIWRLLIIDRYLLRQFVQTFLICFLSLDGLYVVIDGFGNLEEFINYGRDHGGLAAVMADYYGYRALTFFDMTSPVLTLIAAMFTLTWIQRHNEMTAIESAGVPKIRIIRPIVIAALVIVLASVANREFVIPSVRDHLNYNAQDLGGASGKPLRQRYDNETDICLGGIGSKVYVNEQRIEKPDFYMPRGLDRYGPRLSAQNAYYRPPGEGRPGGYLFQGLVLPKSLANERSLMLKGRPVVLTPRDYSWLKSDECFVASNVGFDHLEAGNSWRQLSSTAELIKELGNRSLDFGADERLEIHSRVVQPLLNMTLLFLGLPLVLSRSNRNVFLAIGLCLALVVAFMLVVLACNYLGSSYWFEPATAAWLPLMIFVPCAVAIAQPLWE